MPLRIRCVPAVYAISQNVWSADRSWQSGIRLTFPLTSLFIGLKMPSPRRQCCTAQKTRSQPRLRVNRVISGAAWDFRFSPESDRMLRDGDRRFGPQTGILKRDILPPYCNGQRHRKVA